MALSIFLVFYLYDSKLVSVRKTPLSQVAYQIASFLHANNTDLVALNNGKELVRDIVVRAQSLLDKWDKALNIIGGDLKLKKCVWSLQDCEWKSGKCVLKKDAEFKIVIKQNGRRVPIKHIQPQQPRVLVGIEVNTSHDSSTVLPAYAIKIQQHATRLHTCRLPQIIMSKMSGLLVAVSQVHATTLITIA